MTEVEGKKPLIFSDSIETVLIPSFNKLLKNRHYRRNVLRYFAYGTAAGKTDSNEEFESLEEYRQYVNDNPPVTLRGESVKSYGEMHVANILAMNGVRYIYEHRYEIETADKRYAQYTPDFYLPDYGIYIEFFGIDRNGNVPSWFEGDDPTRSYQEGIQWKRKIHKQNGTVLIECYAYEDAEGILESNLEKKLAQAGVEFKDISINEILASSNNASDYLLKTLLSNVGSVIQLARNNKVLSSQLIEKAGGNVYAKLLAEIAGPLMDSYEEHLRKNKQIDFADMLIRAEQYVSEGKYKNLFKYIIVDEYQDITASQFRLLAALRTSSDFNLFCVGDDWQSIYRFNGSDVSYIMDFESFWGDSELSRIETTYRFTHSLITISGTFIMQNPRQIKKTIRSNIDDGVFAVSKIEGYSSASAVQYMIDRLMHLPKGSTVFLLGRYTFDIKLLDFDSRLSVKYETSSQTQKVLLKGRPDLKITFYTAHRSKGLQADYVYILNNMNTTLGFPSKVESNPLIDKLLVHTDGYPYAEERRLFYVALTRAKKHVFLLTVKGKESSFEKELENRYSLFRNETYVCPLCGGRLRIIDGQYGKFFGCENYKEKNCRYKAKVVH